MKKSKKHGNTLIPRNIVARDLHTNPLYNSKTVPPKKGKKSEYKRKNKHIGRNSDMLLFYVLYAHKHTVILKL